MSELQLIRAGNNYFGQSNTTGTSWPLLQLLKTFYIVISLIAQLSEHVSKQLKPHTATLAAMFTAGCQDPVNAVSISALAATAAYINALSNDPDVMLLKCVLTPMLSVMHACLQRGTHCQYRTSHHLPYR